MKVDLDHDEMSLLILALNIAREKMTESQQERAERLEAKLCESF